MTRWRSRLGEAGAEQMLRATIEAGMRMRVVRPAELKRINMDATVQSKAIRFPTDARRDNRMRERLVKAARAEELRIKQSYQHVGCRHELPEAPRGFWAHVPSCLMHLCSRILSLQARQAQPRNA